MKKTKKEVVINVIETVDGAIISNRLFIGSKAKEKAEAIFTACVAEHEIALKKVDLEAMLDDGIYDDGCGYVVMISWPEVDKS
jgi:hypothetical protein